MILRDHAVVRAELRVKVEAAERAAAIAPERLAEEAKRIAGKDEHLQLCGRVFLAGFALNVNRTPAIAAHLREPEDRIRPIVAAAWRSGVFDDRDGKPVWSGDLFKRRPAGMFGMAVTLSVMGIAGLVVQVENGEPVRGTVPPDEVRS